MKNSYTTNDSSSNFRFCNVLCFVEALNALENYPTPKSRQALTSTIENENCFYSVRIDAAQRLAKVLLFTTALFAVT